MQMNPPADSEVRSEADQGKKHRGNPRVDTVPQELCSNEQTPARDPVGSYVPGERAMETFIEGAGI
jgi:hypothetical protein